MFNGSAVLIICNHFKIITVLSTQIKKIFAVLKLHIYLLLNLFLCAFKFCRHVLNINLC